MTATRIGRAAAIGTATAAALVMAAAQAWVIHDRVVTVHPDWPPWPSWAMALGFELCILTTGLAVVVAGREDRRLVLAEGFLLAMSVAVPVTGALGLAPVWLALTLALVPLQYACAFYAAHTLYRHWYGQPVRQPARAPATVQAPAPAQARDKAPRSRASAQADDRRAAALAAVQAGATQAEAARRVGVHPAQVGRWRKAAQEG